MESANDTNGTIDNHVAASTVNAAHDNGDKNIQNTAKNVNIRINPFAAIQAKSDKIDVEQIAVAMIPTAIDRIFRTVQRISQETQIVADLEGFLAERKLNLKVMPFGSATYGFGGIDTDFNICLLLNDGNCLIMYKSHRIWKGENLISIGCKFR